MINPTFPSPDIAAEWAISRGVTQVNWSGGTSDDREDEHDGREPDGVGIWGGVV